MSSPAQVQSVDAIEQFRNQLAKFEQQVQEALETLTAEVQRAANWLEVDRPSHWKQQTKIAEQEAHLAKLDLERCLIFPIAGETPTCRAEKAVVRKAKLRVEYCRDKSERVRHWTRKMNHEMYEYRGRLGQLRLILETELPAAQARLQQIVRSLDAYQVERTPLAPEPATPTITQPNSTQPNTAQPNSTPPTHEN